MKRRIRIQIIGNYLDKICYSLNRAGIYTEDTLWGGNPLGFVSLADGRNESSTAFPKEVRNINHKVVQLTLKKNLDEYLSHDESRFRSNVTEHGKTVRYKNTSTYAVICNTNLVYPLFLYKDNLYSGTSSNNSFSEYLQQEGAVNIIPSMYLNDVRDFYDKYIEILLNEYDRQHIIFVKTAPSLWYLEDGMFQLFNDKILKLRDFIIEADNYFIEKTNCTVVDSFDRYVPDGLLKESFLPCAFYPDFAYDELSADIITAIHQYLPLLIISRVHRQELLLQQLMEPQYYLIQLQLTSHARLIFHQSMAYLRE